MTKTAIHFFLIILSGALASAVLGGLFAALVGGLAPEFVADLFARDLREMADPTRYAASVGMIWGVFIGAVVAAFACGLSVVLKLIGLRVGGDDASKPNESA